MSTMYGIKDPCIKKPNVETTEEKQLFESKRRLLQLPVFVSLTTTLSDAYSTIKQSHTAITSILSATEEGLEKGAKLVSPITGKIGSTLETPLKNVDNAVCLSLDFLEEKIPSISVPSGQVFENMKNFLRCTFTSITEYYMAVLNSIRNISTQLAIEDVNSETQQNVKAKKNY